MRIVAIEAFDEILVLVVVDVVINVATIAMVMMRLLLAKSLHSVVIHVVARNSTASRVDIRTSLHLLCVHSHGMVLIHLRRRSVISLSRLKLLSLSHSLPLLAASMKIKRRKVENLGTQWLVEWRDNESPLKSLR